MVRSEILFWLGVFAHHSQWTTVWTKGSPLKAKTGRRTNKLITRRRNKKRKKPPPVKAALRIKMTAHLIMLMSSSSLIF